MPLKLSLRPHETVVINGAVVQNGDRRGVLVLHNRSRVLREKDLLLPAPDDGALRRLNLALMLYYLDGEREGEAARRVRAALMEAARGADADALSGLAEISALVIAGQGYRALTRARQLCQEPGSHTADHAGETS